MAAQADLSLCWSHTLEGMFSRVAAHMLWVLVRITSPRYFYEYQKYVFMEIRLRTVKEEYLLVTLG